MDRHTRALGLGLSLGCIRARGTAAAAIGRVHSPLVPEPTRAGYILPCRASRKVCEHGEVYRGELEDRARGVDEDVGCEDGEDELRREGGCASQHAELQLGWRGAEGGPLWVWCGAGVPAREWVCAHDVDCLADVAGRGWR